MRCIRPGSGEVGVDSDTSEVVSVIAGDLIFADTEGSVKRGNSDLQAYAMESALRRIDEIRLSEREDLGNALLMFDQAGPWTRFFQKMTRKKSKRKLHLNQLNPELSVLLMDLIARVGLPASFAKELEVVPEEKLKFLFMKLIKDRSIPLKELLEASLLISKEFAFVKRGQLFVPADSVDDDEDIEDIDSIPQDGDIADPEAEGQDFSAASCSTIDPESMRSSEELAEGSYDRFLPRCRAVAASLTLRAATLSDMSQADVVEAYYQYDPTAPERVDPNVVTFGAEFAQKRLGLSSPVQTAFFTPRPGGFRRTNFWTEAGETKKIGFTDGSFSS